MHRSCNGGWVRSANQAWIPQGRRIGWVGIPEGTLYLEPDAALACAQALASRQALGLTPRVLWKRLNEDLWTFSLPDCKSNILIVRREEPR
jgi:hypothetical protein